MTNTFSFWTPADIIKGHDDERMRMGGIASTMDEDADGEFLDPNGFDLNYFLKAGTVNWHHQGSKDPLANVGEPYFAEIRPKEGLYIEVELYNDSDLARRIFKQAEILQKGSTTRKLGFSIEGKALERGSTDKTNADYRIIKKAMITGVAITHMPKNTNTFADIIKGHGVDDEGNPIQFATDVEKSLMAGGTGDVPKNPLVKESLDEDTKVLCAEDKEDEDETKVLTKSLAYERIFFLMGDISISDAEKVYDLSNLISEKNMKTNKKFEKGVTEEDIQKAVALLHADDNLIKGQDEEEEEEDEDGEEEEDDDSEVTKGFGSRRRPNAVVNFNNTLVKGFGGLEATIEQKNQSLGIILKGIYDGMMNLTEELSDLRSENAELRKSIEEGTLVASTPNQRKSVANAQPVDRSFQKGMENDFQKGLSGETIVSVNQHKKVIEKALEDMVFEKGMDAELGNDLMVFNVSGQLSQRAVERLQTAKNWKITQ